MLYVIGGASRSGKTLLARRIVSEKQIPYSPLDALFGALANGAPEFGVRYDDSFTERPLKMWPIVKEFFNFYFREEKDFVIEGDSILPSQVYEMITAGKPIKVCFIGYAEITQDEKFAMVRKYHQGEIDWTQGISDAEIIPMIDNMIEFSKWLKEECDKYKIKYFDISHDFEATHQKIFNHLFDEN